jgi:putative Mg2+ transporter-C (MgtC) family protein
MSNLIGSQSITDGDIVLRLMLALACGFVLGLDRQMRGISAGLRTHMLVALSSAMTVVIAIELFSELSAGGFKGADPLRAIQGLAQAIGFLCAGVIFVSRGNVYGVTTAASLWMTSTIGMAAGAGLYRVAGEGLVLALVVVTVVWFAEKVLPSAVNERLRHVRRSVASGAAHPHGGTGNEDEMSGGRNEEH